MVDLLPQTEIRASAGEVARAHEFATIQHYVKFHLNRLLATSERRAKLALVARTRQIFWQDHFQKAGRLTLAGSCRY